MYIPRNNTIHYSVIVSPTTIWLITKCPNKVKLSTGVIIYYRWKTEEAQHLCQNNMLPIIVQLLAVTQD